MKRTTAFLLAAPSSGSGKTTITLALLRLLARRGLTVQPFKCGPDYLDTALHAIAATLGERQRQGINLDTFMATKEHVRSLFGRYAADADVSVIEGVMGLFDGAEKSDGSSAEIAALLGLPVIMVIDAHSMAYSAAPLLHGFRSFDPNVNVAGVIFNRVGSRSHYGYLETAAHDVGVEPLGYVPSNEAITISERHLGLNTSAEYDRNGVIDAMATHIGKTIELDRLLEIAGTTLPPAPAVRNSPNGTGKTIAVARDEAFSFLYHENIEALRRYGKLLFFSPMHDERLPEADLLYLAGGYPELHAERLSANAHMRGQIADRCLRGGATYAECGGLMYLGGNISLGDGSSHPMCGVLDLDTTMQEPRLTLGYRRVWPDGPESVEMRGHEFHYSRISRIGKIDTITDVRNARGEAVDTRIYRQGNTIATYVHLYWGEHDKLGDWFPNLRTTTVPTR